LAPSYAADSRVQDISLIMILTVYICVSVFSIIYATKMLFRPGISSEVRKTFLKKHVAYVFFFILIWSCVLLNAINELIKKLTKKKDPHSLMMMENGYYQRVVRFPMGIYNQVWVREEDKNYMHLTPLQVVSFIASILAGFVMAVIR